MPLNNKISSKSSSGAAYCDRDTQQFEGLNQQIKSRQSHLKPNETGAEAETKQVKANDHRFTYSESDSAQFQAILPKVRSAKQARKPRTEAPNKNGFENTYKQSDEEQFQALMHFTASQPIDSASKSAVAAIDERSFVYSEQDIKAFNQLTQGDQTSARNTPLQTTNRADRDVGHIKIMEFDGKKDKARKTARRSNLNIKVRYFD